MTTPGRLLAGPRAVVVLALLLALGWVVAAPDGAAADWAYLSISVGGAAVAWLGDHRRPENRRGRVPWLPITLTCNAVGDVLWQVIVWTTGSAPDVSVADLAWLAGYLAMGGIALTGRVGGRRRPGSRVYAVLDGIAALTVALFVVFQTSVATTLADSGMPALTRAAFIAYPVLDAVIIGLMAWRLVLHGRVRPVVALLMLGMGCWMAADLGWLVLASADTVAGWLDAGWLLGVLFMAAVPWVPQSGTEDPTTARGPGHGPWRMALNIAPFTAPALIEVLAWRSGTDVNPVPGLVVWSVLLVLASVRTRMVALDGERAWALVRSQARRSEALAVNSSDAVAVVDAAGRLTAESTTLSRSFGVPAPAGAALADLVAQVGGDPVAAQVLLDRSAALPLTPVELELEGRRPDGSPFWLGGRAVNLLSDADVRGIVVSLSTRPPARWPSASWRTRRSPTG